jgi:hypothetical protein
MASLQRLLPEDPSLTTGFYEGRPMKIGAIRIMVLTCLLSVGLWVGVIVALVAIF